MFVEDLLALNFVMNTSLLYLTARLTGRDVARKRLLAGGLAAACYSLAAYLPLPWLFFSWLGKIAASAIIIVLTFRPARAAEAVRLCGAFLLVSFFLGGAVFALAFLSNTRFLLSGGVFYLEPPRPGMLLGGVILAFIILPGIWRFGERRRRRKADSYRLTVCDADMCVQVQAVVDTGNQLRDPLTGRPLCVASYHALRRLLPEVLYAAFNGDGDPVLALERLDIDRATQFGVAPFRSLENGGILVTYKPARVILEHNEKREERQDLLFALTSTTLSLDNDYQVLLHPFIFEPQGGADC